MAIEPHPRPCLAGCRSWGQLDGQTQCRAGQPSDWPVGTCVLCGTWKWPDMHPTWPVWQPAGPTCSALAVAGCGSFLQSGSLEAWHSCFPCDRSGTAATTAARFTVFSARFLSQTQGVRVNLPDPRRCTSGRAALHRLPPSPSTSLTCRHTSVATCRKSEQACNVHHFHPALCCSSACLSFCHATVHLPVMHASLICMAACHQQVGSWQAPTLGGTSGHFKLVLATGSCYMIRSWHCFACMPKVAQGRVRSLQELLGGTLLHHIPAIHDYSYITLHHRI